LSEVSQYVDNLIAAGFSNNIGEAENMVVQACQNTVLISSLLRFKHTVEGFEDRLRRFYMRYLDSRT
jgi:hypothetical protein